MSASSVPHYSPLLVRSPNLNAWLPDAGDDGVWPRYWTQDMIGLGLGGMIRIDGVTLPWLGTPTDGNTGFVEQTMTPTSTVRKFKTSGVDLNVTFLSPIEPEDLIRQSFPFSYISVDVKSNDGKPHNVQIYIDMQGQWLSYDTATVLTTSAQPGETITFLQAAPANLANIPMKVIARRPEDVTLYLGMPTETAATYQISVESVARTGFAFDGKLNNTGDALPDQPIQNGTDFIAFSLSKDLGDVSTDAASNALFAIGLVRDPSIAFTPSPGGNQESRSPCFRTVFPSVGPALKDFITDFPAARDRAAAFDEQINKAARGVSDDVADLVALTTRSVMASMDVTCGSDTGDVMFFVNAMGTTHETTSPDDTRYSNRMEDLYASWPAIMAINMTYGRYILEPLLKFQENGAQAYALPDLGTSYPIVDGGKPTSEIAKNLGVEESSNMLLMAWAQARFSGESELVDKYYNVFKRWADYLPDNIPVQGFATYTTSADGVASANTNLALKGIIAVRAMAELAAVKQETSASQGYFDKSQELYTTWMNSTLSGNHLLLEYGKPDSWGLMYNMYVDKWLGLHVVAEDVYKEQEAWYQSQAWPPYGTPYDSSTTQVKPHWTAFTAGAVEDTSLRTGLMKTVHNYAFDADTPFIQNTYSLGAVGKPENQSGAISSTYGSMFAIQARSLVAQRQVQFNSSSSDGASDPGSGSGHKSTNAGAIAGGVVGGVGAIVLAAILFLFWRRRQNQQKKVDSHEKIDIGADMRYTPAVTPFVMDVNGADTNSQRYLETRKVEAQHGNHPIPDTSIPSQSRQGTSSGSFPVSVEPNNRDLMPELHAEIDQLRNDVRQIMSTYDPPPRYN